MRVRTILLAALPVLTVACGGNNKLTNSPVSGSYEFVVTSDVTGGVTLVEANLAASGGQSSASGPNQVQILTLENKIWYVNGVCAGSTPDKIVLLRAFPVTTLPLRSTKVEMHCWVRELLRARQSRETIQ